MAGNPALGGKCSLLTCEEETPRFLVWIAVVCKLLTLVARRPVSPQAW
jgi:hypothetical protein